MGKKISIVGTGMDGSLTLTKKGEDSVKNAELLIGAGRVLKPFQNLGKVMIEEYRSEIIAEYINKCPEKNIAVLMSGDCGFYSGAEKLLNRIKSMEPEIICGISSPIYLCSKIGICWNDMYFASFHGRNANAARLVSAHEKVCFILGGEMTVSQLCSKLCGYGLGDVEIHIGENLSLDNEQIKSGVIRDFTDYHNSNLCTIIIVNKNYEQGLKIGINDDEFIREKIPMTKSEVRSVVISKLDIERNDICWDIGCGSGSVSVEMAVQCENGTVYGVDKNNNAAELTEKNCRKFACDNVCIVTGRASDTVSGLPAPDCVFIGGSDGEAETIIKSAYSKNNNVRLVITAVTLETFKNTIDIFDKMEFESEIIQLDVTRAVKHGSHTMMSAENPVFVIKRKIS